MIQKLVLVLLISLSEFSTSSSEITTSSNTSNGYEIENWMSTLRIYMDWPDTWNSLSKKVANMDMIIILTNDKNAFNTHPNMHVFMDQLSKTPFNILKIDNSDFLDYLIQNNGLSTDLIQESTDYCKKIESENSDYFCLDRAEIVREAIYIFSTMNNLYNSSSRSSFFKNVRKVVYEKSIQIEHKRFFCASFEYLADSLEKNLNNLTNLSPSEVSKNIDPNLLKMFENIAASPEEIISEGFSGMSYNESKLFIRLVRQMALRISLAPIDDSNFSNETFIETEGEFIIPFMPLLAVKFAGTDENRVFIQKLKYLYQALYDYVQNQDDYLILISILAPIDFDPYSFRWFDFDYEEAYTEQKFKECNKLHSDLIDKIKCLNMTKLVPGLKKNLNCHYNTILVVFLVIFALISIVSIGVNIWMCIKYRGQIANDAVSYTQLDTPQTELEREI